MSVTHAGIKAYYVFMVTFAMLNFVTLNVQGLRDKNKRIDTFQSLINDNYDVIALQETHCDSESELIWKEEWGGKSIWSKYKHDQAGVAFLFNPKIELKILDEKIDNFGRILGTIVEIENQKLQLVNIYGPNPTNIQESEQFFQSIDDHLDQHIQPIIFGDFNMVENLDNDRSGGNPKKRHTYGKESLSKIVEGFDLHDVWRHFNPNKNSFTWRTKDNRIRSRLDRIYAPIDLTPYTHSTYITFFPWSDHDVCGMKISLPDATPKGKGYWCLNTQYLEQEEYQNRIRKFWYEWQGHKFEFEDIGLWWDCFKIYVKSISIQYAKEIHNLRKNRKYDLLSELDTERAKHQSDPVKLSEIEENLKEIERETNEKVFIHTHTSTREIKEKPNKYFYRLLRVRQNHATMECLMNSDGEIVTKQEDMMEVARNYYQNLYKEKQDVSMEDQAFFLNKIDKFLSETQKSNLDKEIDLEELEKIVLNGNKSKKPGCDGLPYEFYETFWDMIGPEFLRIVKFCLNEAKSLTYSQRSSTICLSYKKNDKRLLKNWRPISLLCCDYKIISKTLANRMKSVLGTVLSDRQTCGVPGRCITHNLIFMRDAIFFCDFNKINGYILSVDQEKAFDMLNRDFLFKVLQKMNFGEKFINWIKVIFKNSIGRVLLNGYISMDFEISRGAKQGCPLSGDVYTPYLEPLDNTLNSSHVIISLPIPGRKAPTTSLYADDMTLALSDKTNIRKVFDIFSKFENATGSKINPEKTQGLALNNPKLDDPIFDLIEWKNLDGIDILGVLFHTKYEQTSEAVWSKIIQKMSTTLTSIRYRNLSLKGKILTLNSLILSKGWYTALAIELPNAKLKEIETLTLQFLWDDRKYDPITNHLKNPIARKTVYQPRDKGGLALLNPKTQQIALQLKFFRDILNCENQSSWLQLPRYWIGFDLALLDTEWHFLRKYPRLDPTAEELAKPPYFVNILETFKKIFSSQIVEAGWAVRAFYTKLLELDEHFPTAYCNFWNRHPGQVDPSTMWTHVHNSVALGTHQDTHYRFLHQILPTSEFQRTRFKSKGFKNTDPKCVKCPEREETNLHAIFKCVAATPIMDFIREPIRILLRNKPLNLLRLCVNNFPDNTPDNIRKMVTGLLQISMHVIWLNRNELKFKKYENHILKSKNTIIKHFKSVLEYEFNNLEPHKFRKKYCHTPEICDVVGDSLIVNLPP